MRRVDSDLVMTSFDPDALLALLRDANRETQEIATAAGATREDAARAARLVLGIAKVKPQEILTLPASLALALLKAATTAGRADVLATAAAHPSKEVAKESKRVLHLMKSRGVAVPEPQRNAPLPAPSMPEPPLPCYASAADGQGERALWLGRAVPGKGVEVAQAVVSDQKGLIELQLGSVGRKEYRLLGKDLLEQGRAMGVVEIDPEHARGIVAAARELNERSGTELPEGASGWLARLGHTAPPPDAASRFPPLPAEEERTAVEGSGRLHQLPLLRGWLADEEPLRALAHKLDEIAVSSLYIDEAQRAEAVARTMDDAVAAYFDAPHRALWAGRLFVAADHLDRTGEPEPARLAAAAARALQGGVEAARIPFARLLLEKAFSPRRTASLPRGPAGGPLIVPP